MINAQFREINPKHTKTYKTYDAAKEAAENVLKLIPENEYGRVLVTIAASPCGRFTPSFHLSGDITYLVAAIANKGYHVSA